MGPLFETLIPILEFRIFTKDEQIYQDIQHKE